ncbi:MAG: tRNA pseudouridine(55) synthase TruB [Planctomycetota bacterium]|nr:tRNA pseudouridine(55) synthase TruB [Planctomycetota bacterium]
MEHASGILVLDKPAGISSAAALRPLKARLGRKVRVGHAGTLDPFATGVVLALVGDATRLSDLAMTLRKRYLATVRFGTSTDTLDSTGTVDATRAEDEGPPPGLEEALDGFRGRIEQVPPAYSALKVDGQRAYKKARGGEPVALAPREVVCKSIELVSVAWPVAVVRLVTGRGFYVRSFARDWGAAVGWPAHLQALRREAIGPFEAAGGVAPDEAGAEHVWPPRSIVEGAGIRIARIGRDDARRFVTGRTVEWSGENGEVAAMCEDRLLGLGQAVHGVVRPNVVLAGARREFEQ